MLENLFRLALLFLTPIIFLIGFQSFFVQRGAFVSYELVIIILLSTYFSFTVFGRVFWSSMISLVVSLQVFFSVAPAYHLSVDSLPYWIDQFFKLDSNAHFWILLVVLTIFTSAFFGLKLSDSKQRLLVVKAGCFLLISMVFCDTWLESKIGRNLVSSTSNSFRQVIKNKQGNTDWHHNKTNSLSSSLLESLEKNRLEQKNVLFVIAESLPLFEDARYNELIWSGLASADGQIFTEHYSEIQFFGSTVPGEMRELCGLAYSGTDPKITDALARRCLPEVWKSKTHGKAIALHGYTQGFFNRISWYQELGFDEIYFGNSFALDGHEKCGGMLFRGTCDVVVAGKISEILSEEVSPVFIYWLTLNGHQPLTKQPDSGDYEECHLMELPEGRLCFTIQAAQVVINSVISVLKKNPNLMVYIVGDHSPGGLASLASSTHVPARAIRLK